MYISNSASSSLKTIKNIHIETKEKVVKVKYWTSFTSYFNLTYLYLHHIFPFPQHYLLSLRDITISLLFYRKANEIINNGYNGTHTYVVFGMLQPFTTKIYLNSLCLLCGQRMTCCEIVISAVRTRCSPFQETIIFL